MCIGVSRNVRQRRAGDLLCSARRDAGRDGHMGNCVIRDIGFSVFDDVDRSARRGKFAAENLLGDVYTAHRDFDRLNPIACGWSDVRFVALELADGYGIVAVRDITPVFAHSIAAEAHRDRFRRTVNHGSAESVDLVNGNSERESKRNTIIAECVAQTADERNIIKALFEIDKRRVGSSAIDRAVD